MTEQQERMAREILSTVRSIQKCHNDSLINVLSRITEETFKSNKLFQVTLKSLLDSSRNSKKIQIIKVLRKVTGMGLKETKEVVDQVEWSESSTVILNEVEAEVAFKVKRELESFGLKPEVERT